MSVATLPIGSWYSFEKASLQSVIDRLKSLGYRVVGPHVTDGAVVYDELDSTSQLPLGVLDEQDGGKYRLLRHPDAGYFDHVVGPHSVKQFLFPPRETIQEFVRVGDSWQSNQPADSRDGVPAIAVIGARSCDLHAIEIQDRVFLHGPYVRSGLSCSTRAVVPGRDPVPASRGDVLLSFDEHGSASSSRIRSRFDRTQRSIRG